MSVIYVSSFTLKRRLFTSSLIIEKITILFIHSASLYFYTKYNSDYLFIRMDLLVLGNKTLGDLKWYLAIIHDSHQLHVLSVLLICFIG